MSLFDDVRRKVLNYINTHTHTHTHTHTCTLAMRLDWFPHTPAHQVFDWFPLPLPRKNCCWVLLVPTPSSQEELLLGLTGAHSLFPGRIAVGFDWSPLPFPRGRTVTEFDWFPLPVPRKRQWRKGDWKRHDDGGGGKPPLPTLSLGWSCGLHQMGPALATSSLTVNRTTMISAVCHPLRLAGVGMGAGLGLTCVCFWECVCVCVCVCLCHCVCVCVCVCVHVLCMCVCVCVCVCVCDSLVLVCVSAHLLGTCSISHDLLHEQ